MPFRSFNSVYAIDDSGELFSPLDSHAGKIKIKPPKSRWAALGAVRFSQGSIHEFAHDWASLQLKIQRELKLPYLPAIHMRLMWGKNPMSRPPCYKGKSTRKKQCKTQNPYIGIPPEKTLEWVTQALEILKRYRKSGALKIKAIAIDVYNFANEFEQWTIEEMEYLLHEVGKETVIPYLKMLHNPYMAVLSDVLADIQVYENHRKVAIIVDNTSDVIGFEVDEKLIESQTKKSVNLTFIGRVDALGFDANQFPLLQASDVVAFFYRRMFDGDQLSRTLANTYLELRPPKVSRKYRLPWNRRDIKDYNAQVIARFILRYQHAYKVAKQGKQAEKLFNLICTPDELAERVSTAFSKKKPLASLGVSVLKKPLDGRDPIAFSYHSRR